MSNAKKAPEKPLHEVYDCFGHYMEVGKPWTDSGGGCSQSCPKRHECYQETKRRKAEDKDT